MDIMDTFYDGDLKDIWDSDLDPVSLYYLRHDDSYNNGIPIIWGFLVILLKTIPFGFRR